MTWMLPFLVVTSLLAVDGASPLPTPAETARNWPGFRGPAAGLAIGQAPVMWDAATGAGVLWSVELPLPGQSSAVVWGDVVYVTGASEKSQEITAFSSSDGAKRWSTQIPMPVGVAFDDHAHFAGPAAPTPVTDGQRVIALFASGALAAVSHTGIRLWQIDLGISDISYGFASSPVLWQDRVVLQLDLDTPKAKRSALLACDLATGRQIWRTERPVGASWASPVMAIIAGRPQIITCANPWIMSYDPRDGQEIWRADVMTGEVATSPAVAGNLVIVATAGSEPVAVRPEGRGDITSSHIVWKVGEQAANSMASPVSDAAIWAMVAEDGTVTCSDVVTGAQLWQHPGEAEVKSSPIVADGRLYVTDSHGDTRIFAWDRTLKLLGVAHLGEEVAGTMAVVAGRIFLRGEKHLFCLGNRP